MILGAGIVGAIGMWGVTVVAMMLPSTLPAVRHVAVNTLSWRRRRAIDTFVGVYLTVWLGFGAVVILVSPLWSGVRGGVLSAAALATAAVWQLTPQKLAALADCHRPVPLPPLGRRATLGVVKFGLRNGSACLRSCWAMMLAMSVASSGSLLLMIALTGMITAEKRAQRPRHAALLVALSLAGAAMIVTATSV
jgi:predicted metal-binding membrane protein